MTNKFYGAFEEAKEVAIAETGCVIARADSSFEYTQKTEQFYIQNPAGIDSKEYKKLSPVRVVMPGDENKSRRSQRTVIDHWVLVDGGKVTGHGVEYECEGTLVCNYYIDKD